MWQQHKMPGIVTCSCIGLWGVKIIEEDDVIGPIVLRAVTLSTEVAVHEVVRSLGFTWTILKRKCRHSELPPLEWMRYHSVISTYVFIAVHPPKCRLSRWCGWINCARCLAVKSKRRLTHARSRYFQSSLSRHLLTAQPTCPPHTPLACALVPCACGVSRHCMLELIGSSQIY